VAPLCICSIRTTRILSERGEIKLVVSKRSWRDSILEQDQAHRLHAAGQRRGKRPRTSQGSNDGEEGGRGRAAG
jgi:hypothetical protein